MKQADPYKENRAALVGTHSANSPGTAIRRSELARESSAKARENHNHGTRTQPNAPPRNRFASKLAPTKANRATPVQTNPANSPGTAIRRSELARDRAPRRGKTTTMHPNPTQRAAPKPLRQQAGS
ncbi:hypothetical protein, partial [Pseudomonas sp.]|uniref:hypothetical protein n=1 Tax=Pseudomonas sp. TaxID=306 RepID=UPI0028A9E12B